MKLNFFLTIFLPLSDLLPWWIIGIKPAPATKNQILRKWMQFRVGAISSEPFLGHDVYFLILYCKDSLFYV